MKDFEIGDRITNSDHLQITAELNTRVQEVSDNKVISFRNKRKLDVKIMKETLKQSHINNPKSCTCADEAIKAYNKELSKMVNEMCPIITKRVRKYTQPCYDKELKLQKKNLRERVKHCIKEKDVENENEFT